ncbi:unnamed protein product, partial [Oikopleura dioica]
MKIAKASLFLVLCINAKNIYNCIQCVPQNTTTEITTTKPTTTLNSTDFSDRIQLKEGFNFIAAREAYFNFDGKKNAVMNFKYALVKGVLYAFGGTPNYKQIFKYEGCNWSDWKLLPATLQEDRGFGSSALTMPSGEEALICFDHLSLSTSCELFDGTKSEKLPFHSSFTHSTGGLGLYQNQPATVGCYENKHNKAEALFDFGWTALPDHPLEIRSHSLVGLDNGAMLLLGGYALNFPQRAIWKLDFYDDNKEGQKHKWWPIGVLKQ